jgi:hypothetical protein
MDELQPGWLSGVIDRATRHLESLPETSRPAWTHTSFSDRSSLRTGLTPDRSRDGSATSNE